MARGRGAKCVAAPGGPIPGQQVPAGEQGDAGPGPARGTVPPSCAKAAPTVRTSEDLERCQFIIAPTEATPYPEQCEATGEDPWVTSCALSNTTLCGDHAHAAQVCPERGLARETPPDENPEGGSPAGSDARGTSGAAGSGPEEGEQPATATSGPTKGRGEQDPSATPPGEVNQALDAGEGPPDEEPTMHTAAALLTLAVRLASAEGAKNPPPAPWGGKPPALGEEDFRALLRQWGYDQVDEGQVDEQGLSHQCYFVALQEACHAVEVFWPAAALRVAILALLDKQHWIDHYESQKYGHVLVSQGPPGSAPNAGQVSASWRSHLRRRGAHGGEPLNTVAAHLLRRPVLLICGTTASVQMRLDMLASEDSPHGRHYRVERKNGTSTTTRARESRGPESRVTRSSSLTTGGTTRPRSAGEVPVSRQGIKPQHGRRRRAMRDSRASDGSMSHMQYKGHFKVGRTTGTMA